MAYTTINDPTKYFNTVTYTGNGASSHAITGVGHQPDWVWIKRRDGAVNHLLHDSIRGVTNLLVSNSTAGDDSNSNILLGFDSDGFRVGANSASNVSSGTFVSWNWKESATSGFDIISYTGNATGRTISHSLSAVPKWIIVKNRSSSENWIVYHVSVGNSKRVGLNQSNAESSTAQSWGGTTPTSSVITLGTSSGTNANGDNFIMYAFADVKGFSKFGSYTGNGSTDGTFVYTGFKPAWFMVKRTSGTDQWIMYDNKRETFNTMNIALVADGNDAEQDNAAYNTIDFLSNGFKCRGGTSGSGTGTNQSGGSYIYMAFAESPFVNSNKVPTNAR